MKISPKLVIVASVVAVAFSLTSCSSTSKNNSADKQAVKTTTTESASLPVAPVTPVASTTSSSTPATIYFNFDKYDVSSDVKFMGDQKAHANEVAATLIKQNVKAQIQGNTDDRGSVEYNLALGEKRANSLKQYFVLNGVPIESLTTISYGKEHLIDSAKTEEAYAKNRRDEVVIQK